MNQNPKNGNQSTKLKAEKKKIKRDVAKVLNKNSRIQERFALENPYAETLLDPFNTTGAKIPDDQLYPSGTFSLTKRVTITTTTNGYASISLGQYRESGISASAGALVPQNVGAGNARNYILGQYFGSGATLSTSNMTPGSTVANDAIFWDSWNNSALGIPTFYSQARLVSFGATIQYTGAPLSAAGKLLGAYTAKNDLGQTAAISWDRLAQVPGAVMVPINELEGLTVLYKPVDYDSFNYKSLVTYHDLGSALARDEFCDGTLWIFVDSAGASASLTLTIRAHYEGIPYLNSYDVVQPTPSPHDPIALAATLNVVQEAPSVIPSAEPAMNMAQAIPSNLNSHIGKTAKKSSVMEQVEGVIRKGLKFGKKVAPLAGMIGKMLL